MAPGAVRLDGREDDRVRARPQRERDRERERPLRLALGLLVHWDPIEGDRYLGHTATARDDGGQDGDLVRDAGAIFRIADGQRERGEPLVVNGPDFLVVGAGGVAGGEDDGVGAFPERQREVQRDRPGRGRLVQARDLAAVHGNEDARHPLRTRDDAGEGHRVLLHAGLIQGRGEEHLQGRDLGDTHGRNPPGSRRGQPHDFGSEEADARCPAGS